MFVSRFDQSLEAHCALVKRVSALINAEAQRKAERLARRRERREARLASLENPHPRPLCRPFDGLRMRGEGGRQAAVVVSEALAFAGLCAIFAVSAFAWIATP